MRSPLALRTAAERSRSGLRGRVARLAALRRTLLQAALGAGLAWAIATELVGHERPFFAPVSALVVLGLTFGRRSVRAVELAVGVSLGILLGDLLVLGIGTGPWQLVLVVGLAMATAILLGGGPLLVQQSAVSAALVVTLQPPVDGLSFARSVDALVGCSVALLLHYVVFPVDPLRLLRREAEPVLRELAGALRDVADAVVAGDRAAVVAAMVRARGVDEHVARFAEALDIGRETAVSAPARRHERPSVERYAAAGDQLDLAVRNVRVLARGALRAVELGDHVPPQVPEALRDLAQAVSCLQPWLDDPDRGREAREAAVRAARTASEVLEQTTNLSVSVIIGQVRSTAVDLLRGTGLPAAHARELVRGTASDVTPRP